MGLATTRSTCLFLNYSIVSVGSCDLLDNASDFHCKYCGFQCARTRFSDSVSILFCCVSELHFEVCFMISLVLFIFALHLSAVA